jgi:hypothetical protein
MSIIQRRVSLSNAARPGLRSWHRAESMPGNDGDAIGQSNPLVGRTALQATASKKPILRRGLAIANGKSGYQFDGVDDTLSLFTIPKPASWTLLVCCAKTVVNTRGVVCGAINAATQSKTTWGVLDIRRSGVNGSFAYQFGDDTNASFGDTAGS